VGLQRLDLESKSTTKTFKMDICVLHQETRNSEKFLGYFNNNTVDIYFKYAYFEIFNMRSFLKLAKMKSVL
jgi:hypothetical protein